MSACWVGHRDCTVHGATAPDTSADLRALIHMTETTTSGGRFWAYCRCGWVGPWRYTRNAARASGDAHLAEPGRS